MSQCKSWITFTMTALIACLVLAPPVTPAPPVQAEEAVDDGKKKPKFNVGGVDQPGATIKGLVLYSGKKYKTKKTLDMATDKFCVGGHAEPASYNQTRLYGKNGDQVTLQNVFVWVSKGIGKKDYPTPDKPAVLDQIGCLYTPRVSGIVTGQTLQVLNSDNTRHNVNLFKSSKNPKFNNASSKGQVITKVFKRAEVGKKHLQYKCDVHGWMKAHMHVVAHPFFAVTQEDGTFELRGLKPGEYELSFWHEYSKYLPDKKTITVTVGEGETKEVTVTYKKKPSRKKS